MKKLVWFAIAASLAAALLTASCASPKITDADALYSSDKVTVTISKPKTPSELAHAEFMVPTPEALLERNPVIVKGAISNVRSAKVSFTENGEHMERNITLFDIESPEFIKCPDEALSSKGKLTLYVTYNDENRYEGGPVIAEGKSMLIFCEPTKGIENDLLESSAYADCRVGYPATSLCEETGGYCVFWDIYQNMDGKLSFPGDIGLEEDDLARFKTFSEAEIAELLNEKGVCPKEAVNAAAACLRTVAERYSGWEDVYVLLQRYSMMGCGEFEQAIKGLAG